MKIETTETDLFRSRKHKGQVEITLPTLAILEISGANNASISGFKEDRMEIEINGYSKVNFDVDINDLEIKVQGASTAVLTGSGGEMLVKVSGASGLEAFDYSVDICNVKVTGASNAEINVKDMLEANASGASNILYKGLPKDISSEVSGFSSIKPKK